MKAPKKIPVAGLHGTVYRVMYMSESVLNKPVPVTGLVIVPGQAVMLAADAVSAEPVT